MAKMQNVSFRNIEEFLSFLPEDELKTVILLRKIVFSCAPDIREKLSYNVPFYKYHKTVCFIWPAAVLWGKKKSYTGVRFGFSNGHLLTDDIHYLVKEKGKYVYWKDFQNAADVNADLLRSYLFEALAIDEEHKKVKNTG